MANDIVLSNNNEVEEGLVFLKNDEPVCSSIDVAEKFGRKHKSVLRAIENLLSGLDNLEKNQSINRRKIAPHSMFRLSQRKAAGGQMYRVYYMNRDGFSLLVMGFTGKEALEWKLKYINAFNSMENFIKEKSTQEWVETRKNGKLTRKAETDIIKQLIEYAKEQGSEHSNMLYVTYSKLANKMAGVSDRDLATTWQLNQLSLIEHIILNQIRAGMKINLHYKEIYKDCKRQIELFKNIAYLDEMVHMVKPLK